MNDKAAILAVDDTSESLALLVRILTQAGYQVRPADSGELALAAVAANLPDLILLDIRMQGIDGLEVCRRLKSNEHTQHIPIILISAFADVQEWVAGLQVGAADYITKPFQAEELLIRVETHLALKRARVSLEQQASALRSSNARLSTEIVERKSVEDKLRQSLNLAEGSRLAMLSALEDQKEAQEQIRLLNTGLEQRVARRTAQLETSNKELESFAYSVSHDLRAPLRAIDGFSRILQQEYADKLDDEGLRLLGVVRNSTKTMDQLITDLLALSKVSRSELKYSPIDMTAMVKAIYYQMATPEVLEKFVFTVSDLPGANGDPTLMRQVWMNLISNAIKYTLPREVCAIQISGSVSTGLCTYAIKDNGVGYNPKYTDNIFGLFQRLHRSGEFEGTGVGLAIVKRIIHRHGGQVWGEGQVGAGATFYFTLPERQVNDA
jgi:two-component system sensor histidine kinase/response regulator